MLLETPRLDALEQELKKLKRAQELLEEIWDWHGPYGPEKAMRTRRKGKKVAYDFWIEQMPQELRIKLQQHFNFDDSE